jgi:hypothetical protein
LSCLRWSMSHFTICLVYQEKETNLSYLHTTFFEANFHNLVASYPKFLNPYYSQITFLLARSFFIELCTAVLALLARVRVLIQQVSDIVYRHSYKWFYQINSNDKLHTHIFMATKLEVKLMYVLFLELYVSLKNGNMCLTFFVSLLQRFWWRHWPSDTVFTDVAWCCISIQ